MEETIKVCDEEIFESEEIEDNKQTKKITIADILILQTAICLVIVMAMIFIHLSTPGVYDEIIAMAKSEMKKPFPMTEEFNQAVAQIREIINAKL